MNRIEQIDNEISYIKGYLPVLKSNTFADWFGTEEKLAEAIAVEEKSLRDLKAEQDLLLVGRSQ